ncbi:MAG: PorT family protein [Gemmatimonadota bacterium]|nr:PorT family protein [Gemmatimonadota bacterium]MDH3479489.1 PorT family protein [Gemmatimonadota bacterium]MDH3570497.1 PorT family protein [Gemmatimonadota bacterium]MDH5550867.1 PorT family protein [Gemmatimonadota bacterium]
MSKVPVTAFAGVVLALSSATEGHAQGVSLGVVGGVNVATLAVEGYDAAGVGAKVGINTGLRLCLGLGPRFGVMLGVLYSRKGGTVHRAQSGDVDYALHYIDFPILAQLTIPTDEAGKLKVHLAVGPAVEYEADWVWGSSTGGALMALGGLDIRAGRGAVILDAAYSLGLSGIDTRAEGLVSRKNRTLSFLVGYSFGL